MQIHFQGFLKFLSSKFAVFFGWSQRVSGAEGVAAAGSPFFGPGSAALLIKPWINYLTQAELHQVMTSGFATLSAGMIVAYMAVGVNAQALVASGIMSIPAGLVISKMRHPETEESLTMAGRVSMPEEEDGKTQYVSGMHALIEGGRLGLQVAGMALSTTLVMLGIVMLIDVQLIFFSSYLGMLKPLTLDLIFGYVCYPIVFMMGVPAKNGDLLLVSQLLGTKLFAVGGQQSDADDFLLTPRFRENSSRTRPCRPTRCTLTCRRALESSPRLRYAASPASPPSARKWAS